MKPTYFQVGCPFRPHGRTSTGALLVRAPALLLLCLGPLAARADDSPPALETTAVEAPVVDAPAPSTARERLDEAWRRVDRGDWDGAILLARDASARSPDDAPEAGYLEGVALSGAGRSEQAIAAFQQVRDRWPDRPQALDASFRQAIVRADQGRFDEALATLDALQPVRRLPEEGRLKIALCTATWTLERDGDKRAWKGVHRALARVAPDQLGWFQALAHRALLRRATHGAELTSLDVPDPQVARAVEMRGTFLRVAEQELGAIADLHEPRFALDGILDLGAAYARAGDDLRDARPPASLPEDEQRRYADLVRQRAEGMWVKASRLYDLGLDTAGRFPWADTYARRLTEAQAEVQARFDRP